MAEEHKNDPDAPVQAVRAEVHFRKSDEYRIVYADGAWGGLTPALSIRMGFFTTYKENPESVTYEAQDGKLVVVNRVGREGIIREMQVDVVLSQDVARTVRDWLTERLEEADRVLNDPTAAITTDDAEI